MSDNVSKKLGKAIQIDETQIHEHLDQLVRGSVEKALNNLLNAESDQFLMPHVARETKPVWILGLPFKRSTSVNDNLDFFIVI